MYRAELIEKLKAAGIKEAGGDLNEIKGIS